MIVPCIDVHSRINRSMHLLTFIVFIHAEKYIRYRIENYWMGEYFQTDSLHIWKKSRYLNNIFVFMKIDVFPRQFRSF